MRYAAQWALAVLMVGVTGLLAVGWAESYTRPPAVLLMGPGGRPVILAVGHGVLYCLCSPRSMQAYGSYRPVYCVRATMDEFDSAKDEAAQAADHEGGRFQFWYALCNSGPAGSNVAYVAGGVPLWLLWPIGAGLAWRSTVVIRTRYRRRRLGLCPVCGYDVRGIVTRCPECGAAVEAGRTLAV